MSDQPSSEAILNKTLFILVEHIGLTADEVSTLRLSHLHLAGKSPNLNFTVGDDNSPKTVELDLEAHRALVGWLVARPDSASDLLFPGDDGDALNPLAIQRVVKAFDQSEGPKAVPPKRDPADVPRHPPPPPGVAKVPPESDAGSGDRSPGPARSDPLPARPAPGRPPMTSPEAGIPPLRPQPPEAPEADVHPTPMTAPEAAEPAETPQPFPPAGGDQSWSQGGPKPVDPNAARPVPRPVGRSEPKPVPRPVPSRNAPRVPPKPIKKKQADQDPVIMAGSEPEKAPSPISSRPAGVAAAAAATPLPSAEKAVESPPAEEKEKVPEPKAAEAAQAKAPDPTPAVVSTGARPNQPVPLVRKPEESVKKTGDEPQIVEGDSRPAMVSFAIGGAIVLLALCVICGGGAGWFALQGDAGTDVAANLGLAGIFGDDSSSEEDEVALLATQEAQSSLVTVPTATLPPTSTPTSIPPTATAIPLPTETPTAIPEIPTDTPVPTDTPLPTDTPTPEPPPVTPTPEETPTPDVTPTSALKYGAPVLIEPKAEIDFIGHNEIILRWESVGELAPDEQYAVRMVYPLNGQVTYQGTQVKEPQWVVPLSLYQKIDPPENRYEWFIVVERLNDDGSGTPISPESERRSFTWK